MCSSHLVLDLTTTSCRQLQKASAHSLRGFHPSRAVAHFPGETRPRKPIPEGGFGVCWFCTSHSRCKMQEAWRGEMRMSVCVCIQHTLLSSLLIRACLHSLAEVHRPLIFSLVRQPKIYIQADDSVGADGREEMRFFLSLV